MHLEFGQYVQNLFTQILDGTDPGQILDEICTGRESYDMVYKSSGNVMSIRFKSDSSVTRTGFSMSYTG